MVDALRQHDHVARPHGDADPPVAKVTNWQRMRDSVSGERRTVEVARALHAVPDLLVVVDVLLVEGEDLLLVVGELVGAAVNHIRVRVSSLLLDLMKTLILGTLHQLIKYCMRSVIILLH